MRQVFRAVALLLCIASATNAQTSPNGIRYPATTRGTQVDDYHGTRVSDPYRWLEDTDSRETAAWVAAQNQVTFSYLASIPERAAILNRLTQVWNYPKYSSPWRAEGRLFFYENSGLQNQSILYVRDGNRPARALIDPNSLSADGTIALTNSEESPNGEHMAYGVSTSGSDWQEFRVRHVDSGRDLQDTLKWVKFSGIAWTKDNKGFFYSRYDEPKGQAKMTDMNRNQKIYYHRLNTRQSADQLVYDRPDQPNWLFDTTVSHDGTFAILTVYEGTDPRTRLFYIFLDNPKKPKINAPIVRLVDRFDAEYQFIGNVGDNFLIRTNLGAPKGRIVSVDINFPQQNRWMTIVPEGKDALEGSKIIGKQLVLSYLQDAQSSVRFYGMPDPFDARRGRGVQGDSRSGRTPFPIVPDRGGLSAPGYPYIGDLKLPSIGTVTGITGKEGNDEMFYTFVSYLTAKSVYRYDLKRRVSEPYKVPRLAVDATQFETRQVFYNSKDGTRVPMFITHRKGLRFDGNNPTMLYGYGGFNISETPAFSPANLVWIEMGGVLAVPNIRGGGEYGREWHQAGILGKKQNVFDDFIAAAEYLIKEKVTSPSKLAISGGSNGGLLVGAVLNQRPELFGAAVPSVGVMDMLRFHKFTIGWAWTSDYGSADDPKQFQFLRAYSPLHNIKSATRYPATLVLTADHDDRVVPGHSFKYAAALQAAQAGQAPILIRITTKAGHGAGKPTTKQIEESADKFAFLVRNLGMRPTLQ
ncbi:MAG TPA: prolyl oligopeptidase family serine peptidase [Gemmatimonadaceae bacterium]|nr:prolyl oligopeptidase family serine peptidase [Gemmatimonadaceae bacterium]